MSDKPPDSALAIGVIWIVVATVLLGAGAAFYFFIWLPGAAVL